MFKYSEIFKSELIHFLRSPFKIGSLILYIIAILYSCQNGYELYNKHISEIKNINNNVKASINDQLLEFDAIKSGIKETPRRDPQTPYWAIRNTSTYTIKQPSPLMVFSIGQAEQYGYYKKITNWSTVFDSDLIEEITNPERLAINTLDFNFVILFLIPILSIVLLFNILGFEKEVGLHKLISLSNVSIKKWTFIRFLFYFLLINFIVMSLMIFFAFRIGIPYNTWVQLLFFAFLIFIYLLFWFFIFYIINLNGKNNSDNAIKMITTWAFICIIVPGIIHQVSTIKYPTNYMSDFIDVSRDKSDYIFDLPYDSLKIKLIENFQGLKQTKYAADTSLNKIILNRSLSGLVNILNKKVAQSIEKSHEEKNNFVKKSTLINPVIFFQNKINSLAETDYYAFKNFRQKIQSKIDKQIDLILLDTWNEIIVTKEKYLDYTDKLQ